MVHSASKGSQIAKSGFKNEEFVKSQFNQWKISSFAQQWLQEMGYDLKNIHHVEAKTGRETNRSSQKSDLIVIIDGKEEKISIKYSKGSADYNQIGRGWIDTFASQWNMPEEIIIIMKKYVGEKNYQISDYMSEKQITELERKRETYLSKKTLNAVRKHKRLCILDFSENEQRLVLNFFDENRNKIASYLMQGKEFPVDWLLVVAHDKQKITRTKVAKMSEFIDYIKKFPAEMSPDGVLRAAHISFQRKSGDPGRIHKETGRYYAEHLQPKFYPSDIFQINI